MKAQAKFAVLLIATLLPGAGTAVQAKAKSGDRAHRLFRPLPSEPPPRGEVPVRLEVGTARRLNAHEPSIEEVLAAMKKATRFMVERVGYRGGYVWAVSEDFSRRYGEVPARNTQIWVQSGTPDVGMTLLDAYDVTHDPVYLDGARKAADALMFGQHPLGGWNYLVDFDPKGLKAWYENEASRFKWGMEEYRHYYGNATFDDGNTSSATRFLLRFYLTTRETRYRESLLKALNFILVAQYPNGAWPQRYPLSYEFAHDGFPDYTSYYTLNDGSAMSNIEVLVQAYEKLGDKRYLEAARRGVEFMIIIQGPEDLAAWAEQYDPKTMQPVKARTHEPAGFVIRESEQVIELLEMFYLMTGERRYLKPIPGCLAWFDRVNREAVELKRPPARYYEPGTNMPVYNLPTEKTNAAGYGLYRWSNTESQGDRGGPYRFGTGQSQISPVVDVLTIRKKYERIAALSPEQARVEYQKRSRGWDRAEENNGRPVGNTAVADLIVAMDSHGAWLRDDVRVLTVIPRHQGLNPGTFETIRGYSTATFVRNLRRLIAYAKEVKHQSSARSVTWRVNNLKRIGGRRTTMLGNPQVVSSPNGKAVLFDGMDDGLIVDDNPIAGARVFTVEAVFRPDSGGTTEQRWFHIQEKTGDNRVLLEIRLTGDQWFLDSFIKSGEDRRTLYSDNFKHRTGEWYHVSLVYDGIMMRHYVDGKEELSGPLAVSPFENGSTSIGVRVNRMFWFKGAIRKARFTPRALSPQEFMEKG